MGKRLIESYGLGEIITAIVAGVGTFTLGDKFALAFGAGVVISALARKIDYYGIRPTVRRDG
jgi:hypothetical protein